MNSRELMDSVTRDMDHPRGGIEERIELDIQRHRKGWGRFVLSDSQGKPIQNAKLKFTQTKHEFLFGSNLFKLCDFPTKKQNDLYEKLFKKVFNIATLPFYWDTLEPEPGKLRYSRRSPPIARRPPTDLAVDWCLENGIRPKGHWLFCDNFVPAWLPQNAKELMVLLEKRIAQLAERYGEKVTLWDAVNEAFSYPRWFHPRIAWSVVPQDYVYQVFKLAEKYFPNYVELCYNDGNHIAYQPFHYDNSPMYLLCKSLLDRGARLGGIGIQFHMYGSLESMGVGKSNHFYFDPVRQFRVLDQYARLGLPLHMTETSLPTYAELPRKEAEDFQAKLLRHFYRIWFSQEKMESIVWWNLVDKTAYGAESDYDSGLLSKDMEEKPAYQMLDRLINQEWHTECTVKTDENGVADWNGFYGDYDLEITAGRSKSKRKTSLSKHSYNEYRITL
ncbi:MAG: glycoside hydrolase family 10 [Lentisphaerae bacterium]|nr:glycoside hydrolase family 10 [Lentisphaerota bacterium]